MRFVHAAWGPLVVTVSLVACDKETPKPSAAPPAASAVASAAASAAPSASASAAPVASATLAAQGKMAHCPSAVAGSTTNVKDIEGGVSLTVTAKDAPAVADLRARAKFLADSAKNMSPDVKHTGGGEGGGAFGRCPVVMRNTSVEVKEVEGGAEIAVKPKDTKELDWLRRESRERLAEMGDPNAKEAGQGKMANCPSAVDGATTTVKELKDGVEVTIVGKGEGAEKTIRERAKAVITAAKLDAQKVTHKGDGSGGGGFGRCPVVLKETKVESKDVPGGVVFTVKPEKPAGLADLKKETAERAQKFASTAAPTADKAKDDKGAPPKPATSAGH